MRLRPVIAGFALTIMLYATVFAAVLIAKDHASRGTLGISLGAR